jgi:hypothetical protein
MRRRRPRAPGDFEILEDYRLLNQWDEELDWETGENPRRVVHRERPGEWDLAGSYDEVPDWFNWARAREEVAQLVAAEEEKRQEVCREAERKRLEKKRQKLEAKRRRLKAVQERIAAHRAWTQELAAEPVSSFKVEDYVTPTEVGMVIGASPQQVGRWGQRGDIPSIIENGRRYFPKEWLEGVQAGEIESPQVHKPSEPHPPNEQPKVRNPWAGEQVCPRCQSSLWTVPRITASSHLGSVWRCLVCVVDFALPADSRDRNSRQRSTSVSTGDAR